MANPVWRARYTPKSGRSSDPSAFGANRQHQYEILSRSASVCCNNAAVTIYTSGSEASIVVFGGKTNNMCRVGADTVNIVPVSAKILVLASLTMVY